MKAPAIELGILTQPDEFEEQRTLATTIEIDAIQFYSEDADNDETSMIGLKGGVIVQAAISYENLDIMIATALTEEELLDAGGEQWEPPVPAASEDE
jgi:hypothetical protein